MGTLKWKYNFEGDKLTSINKGAILYKSFDYYDNDFLKIVQEGSNLLEYIYYGEEFNSQLKYTVGTQTPIVLDFYPDDVYRTKEIHKNGEKLVSFQYNQNGLTESVSYATGSSISMQYDRSRLSSYTMKSNSSQVLDAYTFEYDANNNIKKVISNAGFIEYEYDGLNQLKSEKLLDGTILTYEYDEVGNRTKKSITVNSLTTTKSLEYNGANQLTKVGSRNYQYDGNGNLISDGIRVYIFNEFNQLIEITDTSGQRIANYTYDEEGKRKSKKTSEGTIHYYYDGNQLLYETNDTNQVLREYTYDPNGQVLTMTKNGETFTYLFNYHGDVLALTDSRGDVVASYTYDAWGNILSQSGTLASENPYRYAGYRYDQDTKLYYLLARYYNPEDGGFLSIDPLRGELEDPLTLNGYTYVSNNPVKFVDPNGMKQVYQGYGGVGGGAPISSINKIKNVYNSIKQAPKYPSGFKALKNGTKKVNVKNKDILDKLRGVESGQWKKIYKDGYDSNGKKISIHYFQSQSGRVFDVKVKSGWSNK